jgi:hypothetical protein
VVRDEQRRKPAHVPEELEFATKPALGTGAKLREACEKNNKGYVLAVPVNFAVTLPSGRKATVAALSRLIPAATWETRSCTPGCKGHRDYAWA